MNYQYFVFSCCFSCLSIKRFYAKLNLYTDNEGYDLLIKDLNLPYEEVSLALNQLAEENSKLWVLGKLLTIQLQKSPFIHIDNDIYLWEKLPESNSSDFLIAQSSYKIPYMHTHSMNEILKKFHQIPSCITKPPTAKTKNTNIGVIGGNNTSFFQEYCQTAYQLLEKNKNCLDHIDIGPFNQVLDEYLFTSMVRDKKLDITYVIEDSPFDDLEDVNAAVRFNLTPVVNKYIHLLGNLKQNKYACEQLALRFEYEFPEYYQKALHLVKEKCGNKFMTDHIDRQREQRLKKAIPLLYNSSLTCLREKKLRLIENARIEKNENGESQATYSLIIPNTVTSIESVSLLKGTDVLLAYFQTPVTVDELLEELKFQNPHMEPLEYKKQEFKILDIITEKVMIDGLLEFV